ncbi:MBL fold metallo-hydrolase [Halobacillus yeomjeoni]|uniref:MBL fold metallo-hydrolase n=1 Tax=Halobacillus yeomjeoni TaxID=311194 RepID=UPI001CD373B1|nr:MBL fold metallo-hydrolase [Halobacillus yeomjeoni]MCA0984968.1 MBL fold metallo-hydrolase [Halobacillus yeomjeoni]
MTLKHREPIELGEDIHLIDGYDLGWEGRTGTYVLKSTKTTLIETGPSPSVPRVLKGLEELAIQPEEVENIILTHIHLDHAGGAGLLVKECSNAKVFVHERGIRHLADPSKLIKGAKMVYGEEFDELFDPILPIPEEKLISVREGEALDVGGNRSLTFLDTPGHAKHHIGIYDSKSKGLFIGDTAGIQYHQTEDYGLTFYLPTTSPNQFDPDAMLRSIERFRNMEPRKLFFGHFGETGRPEKAMEQVESWIPIFVETAEKAHEEGEGVEGVAERLHQTISSYLRDEGIPDDHSVYEILKIDLEVCAMGLLDYLNKRSK